MRVAVVGAGPAGLYAAEYLASSHDVEVDVFDALPVPFGLVRYGVAPDHFSIRSVRDKLSEVFNNPLVRFRGNVLIGQDISTEELSSWYDAVLYSYGAARDRKLGIPGEDNSASFAATDFVKWYTGHPDAKDFAHHLVGPTNVTVVGLGNVAVDVTRLLVKPMAELKTTDMPEHVLSAFEASTVKHIHVVGRRGPQHATFTTKELKELGELEGVFVEIDSQQLPADFTRAAAGSKVVERNLGVMKEWAQRENSDGTKSIRFHFYSRPDSFDGDEGTLRVENMKLTDSGDIIGTGDFTSIPTDLLIRSVGYRGEPLQGLAFDEKYNVVPHQDGLVDDDAHTFVAGWIKRGPSGIIGTNKKDAVATVDTLITRAYEESVHSLSATEIDDILTERGIRVVDFDGWRRIDQAERNLGAENGRARTTISSRERLLTVAQKPT